MSDIKTENMWLMKGDCLERMKEIESGSVDMILTDSPFGTTACKWDSIIPLEPMWTQLKRVIKPNGAICLFSAQPFTSKLISSNFEMYKYNWFWKKNRKGGFVNAKLKPLKVIEEVCVFSKGKTSNGNKNNMIYYPQGLERCDKLSEVRGTPKENSYARPSNLNKPYKQEFTNYPTELLIFDNVHNVNQIHPTQKPVALMEYLIKTYTNEGETVLDFASGSFTTGVACVNLNRKFIGIELDKDYFDIGVNRIKERIKCLDSKIEPEISMAD
jgi:site-specific DNA-methyltransferase (adenine-specific)